MLHQMPGSGKWFLRGGDTKHTIEHYSKSIVTCRKSIFSDYDDSSVRLVRRLMTLWITRNPFLTWGLERAGPYNYGRDDATRPLQPPHGPVVQWLWSLTYSRDLGKYRHCYSTKGDGLGNRRSGLQRLANIN